MAAGANENRQCSYRAERLVRSWAFTGHVWVPMCARHMDLVGERDPDAMSRPLSAEPLNRPPLRECRPAPGRRELVSHG